MRHAQHPGGLKCLEYVSPGNAERDTGDAAEHREDETLRERLPDEARASGAKR